MRHMIEHGDGAVLLEREGGVATVRFNRPDKLNAADDDLIEGLNGALEAVDEDPEDGLLVTGQGDATQAGLDTDIAGKYPEEYPELEGLIGENARLLRNHPRPTAMAGKGVLVGLGFTMSLNCDFLVLGEETHFSLPEIKYGISTTGSIPRLQSMVGPRVAKEIATLGEPIDPGRAGDLGLANAVVPEEEVEGTAREMLRGIAEHDANVVEGILDASEDHL